MDINKAIIVGRICSEVELKTTTGGQSVLQFAVATNRRWKEKDGSKKEEATYHNAVAWGKTAEIISQFFGKGDTIGIFGRIKNTKYEKEGMTKTSSQIVIDEFYFGNKKGNKERAEGEDVGSDVGSKHKTHGSDTDELDFDDIP